MPLLTVFTTTATRDEAQRIATALVERRLVACAQLTAIERIYRWDGRVCADPEWRLMLKTAAARDADADGAAR